MNINLHIASEALAEFDPAVYSDNSLDLDIAFFLPVDELKSPQEDAAYVLKAEDLSEYASHYPSIRNWVCCGVPSETDIVSTPGNIMVLPHSRLSSSLLLNLNSVVIRYMRWSDELTHKALEGQAYKQVLSSVAAKELIAKHGKAFGGSLDDGEVMRLCGCSRNTYYKYKREIACA